MGHRMLLAIFALLFVQAAPVAFADGGDVSLIHACVHKVAGNVRIVAPAESCRPPESPVHWTIQGAASGAVRGVQLFLDHGVFTVPPGITSVLVELWGGGGAAGLPLGPSAISGGGGAGGYLRTVVSVTPGQIVAVTVGHGGAATCEANGGAGGDTAFGTLVTVRGGQGGTVAGQGGAGGSADPGGISHAGEAGAPTQLGGIFARSAQGSFAPPGRTPGRGGFSLSNPFPFAQTCSLNELELATGQRGQLIVQW